MSGHTTIELVFKMTDMLSEGPQATRGVYLKLRKSVPRMTEIQFNAAIGLAVARGDIERLYGGAVINKVRAL